MRSLRAAFHCGIPYPYMSKAMQEFEKKTALELQKLLAEKREALRSFRFNMSGSRVRNTKEGVMLRKAIARILFKLGAQESDVK